VREGYKLIAEKPVSHLTITDRFKQRITQGYSNLIRVECVGQHRLCL